MKPAPLNARQTPPPASLGAGAAITALTNGVGRQVARWHTAAVAPLGLNYLEARLLRQLLTAPPDTAAELSEILGVDPAAVSRSVQLLKLRGLILVDHQRRLRLTVRGKACAQTAASVLDQAERRLVRGFTANDCRQLTAFLVRLQDNLAQAGDSAA